MVAGTLFLVVGPSGAGKDTLLSGARETLKDDARFVFARRMITRPADAGGEDHTEISGEEFETLRRQGAFFLSWSAHGLDYGLPATLTDDLAAGRNVVANVSRSVIADAASRTPHLCAIVITAPAAVLAGRLGDRGRETEADIAARLARDGAAIPDDIPRIDISNDATPEEGIRRLVNVLTGFRATTC